MRQPRAERSAGTGLGLAAGSTAQNMHKHAPAALPILAEVSFHMLVSPSAKGPVGQITQPGRGRGAGQGVGGRSYNG